MKSQLVCCKVVSGDDLNENTKILCLNDYRRTANCIYSLVRMKNRLLEEDRYTDCVDELIAKIASMK